MRHLLVSFTLLVCALCLPSRAEAHALEPGYLEITETAPQSFRVFWRKPDVQQRPMDIVAKLPDHCDASIPPAPWFDGSAWVSEWATKCADGIAGHQVYVHGLEDTKTDVLLRVKLQDHSAFSARLTPKDTGFDIPSHFSSFSVLMTYIGLGIEHILEGFDHLLFVFALLVLIRDKWRMLGAITAFTLAHSITLALASLDMVRVPAPPVEAVIALSIVFLAVEIAKRNESEMRLSERWPWIVSFSFGLLHGLGFAGALREIGLPEGDIFVALLGFNLGVEAGQILFVIAILAIGSLFARAVPAAVDLKASRSKRLNLLASYAIGSIASFWLVERVYGFWV